MYVMQQVAPQPDQLSQRLLQNRLMPMRLGQ